MINICDIFFDEVILGFGQIGTFVLKVDEAKISLVKDIDLNVL